MMINKTSIQSAHLSAWYTVGSHSRIFISLKDLTDNKAKMCSNDFNSQRKGIYQRRTLKKIK